MVPQGRGHVWVGQAHPRQVASAEIDLMIFPDFIAFTE